MAYIPKPGSFTLFKNTKKETDSHPDYRGDGLDLMGEPVWVSAWIREGAKGKFMSCSMQHKNKDQPKPKKANPGDLSDMDDSIPF
jgi:hypothetical protein